MFQFLLGLLVGSEVSKNKKKITLKKKIRYDFIVAIFIAILIVALCVSYSNGILGFIQILLLIICILIGIVLLIILFISPTKSITLALAFIIFILGYQVMISPMILDLEKVKAESKTDNSNDPIAQLL